MSQLDALQRIAMGECSCVPSRNQTCWPCIAKEGLKHLSREHELEEELKFMLTVLDWGSLGGPEYQAYWRAKALVGTPQEKEWANRKLAALWRCEDHSPRKRPGFSPYEGEMRDGPREAGEPLSRPTWASGPEWEGWKFIGGGLTVCAVRKSANEKWLEIAFMDQRWWVLGYTFSSPESALRVANCIAAELGGWE